MRAILIDPYNETISEVEHTGGIDSIYKLLSGPERKVGTFTIVGLGKGETLYVDDEGLLHNPTHFFQWQGYHQPLAGRGLILGSKRSEDAATKLSLDEAKARVRWANNLQYEGSDPIPEGTKTIHPVLGEMFVVGSTPVFSKK
jgi:hypothetical protein